MATKTSDRSLKAAPRMAHAKGGLRERKKAERRAALLDACRSLFNSKGFDATSIEDVAAQADVSVGTVYNYFDTKSDLLFAMLLQDLQTVAEENSGLPSRGKGRGSAAMGDLLARYFGWFDRYDRALLRRFTADAIASPSFDERSYFYLEGLILEQIAGLIRALQASGELRDDFNVEGCSRLIFNLANSEFYAYVADDRRSSSAVRASLESQIDMLWTGLSKR